MTVCRLSVGIFLIGVLGALQATASSITLVPLGTLSSPQTNSGTLPSQAQVIEESFTLGSSSSVTAFTTSYGGGANLNGLSTTAGGFEPMLSLFTSTGMFIAGESVTSPIANVDTTTDLALDAYLHDSNLAAGSYILVLTDWLNQQPPTATNLSSGFVDLGSGGSTFVDEQFNTRTAAYSLNLSATPLTATPEPGTIWLLGVPLFVGLFFRKRSTLQKYEQRS